MIPKSCLGIILFVLILTCCFYILIAEDTAEFTVQRGLKTLSNQIWTASSTSWEEKCDCGPNSEGCYFKGSYKVCKCHPGYKQTSNSTDSTCEECDCGANSISCHYMNNLKICTCRKGDSGYSGKCLKCDCGIGAISCKFLINSRLRKCVCKQGYAPYSSPYNNFDEECKKCDCGPSSLSCKFKADYFKECTCKPGSKVIRGGFLEGDKSCSKVCDCGLNAISCSFDAFGDKKCICKSGYAYNKKSSSDKVCKECDCGPHAASCYFNNISGKRMCTCQYEYISKSQSIFEDDECIKSGSSLSRGTSSWKIATYVTIAVFGVIISSLMYIIRRERWQRWWNA